VHKEKCIPNIGLFYNLLIVENTYLFIIIFPKLKTLFIIH